MKKLILIISMALACCLAFAQNSNDNTLYIIDGVVATKAAADELPSETIKNMNVVKGVESVVVITTHAGREISGRVVDTEGKPMFGVLVTIPMTGKGVVTDMDGAFKIVLPAGEAFLKFAFIDYPTKLVQVDKADLGDVVLEGNAVVKGSRLFLVKKTDGTIYKIDSWDSIPASSTRTIHAFKSEEAEQFSKYGDISNGVVLVELK